MYPKLSANLGNLVLSISDALDLPYPSLVLHQQRVAFIAWELAKAAGLAEARVERVFLAGLLHDIGALAIEEKRSLHENEVTDVEDHCIRGANLFSSNPWLSPCADLVRHHHREWLTWGEPWDTPLVFDSQLLRLADHLERHIDRAGYILHQSAALRGAAKEMSGSLFCPAVVDLFLETSCREAFWLDLTSPRLNSLLLHNGPFQAIEVNLENIVLFARLLGMIVDFKSRFTATHSSGVAACAMRLAELSGMSESEVRLMEAAGLLHDLGKLVIPNAILEKPSSLTAEEMAVMKQHTYYTYSILGTISEFRVLAEWGGYHHERLDGKGYPFRRKSHELNLGARIMAVSDIFTAVFEDRPYRKGMSLDSITTILRDMASRSILDPRVVSLLVANIGDIRREVSERQKRSVDFYRREIMNPRRACPS